MPKTEKTEQVVRSGAIWRSKNKRTYYLVRAVHGASVSASVRRGATGRFPVVSEVFDAADFVERNVLVE